MPVDIFADGTPGGMLGSTREESDRDLPPFVHMSVIPDTLRRPATHAHSHRPYYCFLLERT
jgi:hypothetical protein